MTDKSRIAKAKQKKIKQIAELKLIPMFIRYAYKNNNLDISSAHVVFQKEVLAEKWNMIHITEISFIVNYADFDEFEKISGVSLSNNFRDLTSKNKDTLYKGKERRKENR